MPLQASAQTYRPRTQAEVRISKQDYLDLARLTGMPLSQVMRYGDQILKQSMFDVMIQMEDYIKKYVPKATGQLRESLTHQLHNSTISNNWLQMKLGTYVKYMKYVANMNSTRLRHPKVLPMKYSTYQRNSKHGKKGQKKKNPGQWRYVYYYGAPRWVKLDDPQAQTNFYTLLITLMRTNLQKAISAEIRATLATADRRPFYNKFKVT